MVPRIFHNFSTPGGLNMSLITEQMIYLFFFFLRRGWTKFWWPYSLILQNVKHYYWHKIYVFIRAQKCRVRKNKKSKKRSSLLKDLREEIPSTSPSLSIRPPVWTIFAHIPFSIFHILYGLYSLASKLILDLPPISLYVRNWH